MRWEIGSLVMATAVWAGGTTMGYGYEALYERTPVGVIEVKEIPASRMLEATSDRGFFDKRSDLFMTLFRYIKKQEVAMTVPVESDVSVGNMRFLVPSKRSGELPDQGNVQVKTRPAQRVVSIGLRGAYRETLARSGIDQLEKWLQEHPEYEPAGDAYGVYWNSPFVPGVLKRSEVHIPVAAKDE